MYSIQPTELWSRCQIASPQLCNMSSDSTGTTDSTSTDAPANTDRPAGSTDAPTNTGNPARTDDTTTDHPSTSDGSNKGKFLN